ncbi:MAG: hypothetical protein JW762_02790 [Dehalococcoidales bacterium]|nr:hypothetical protein [Dehalococcoidales bacterium]
MKRKGFLSILLTLAVLTGLLFTSAIPAGANGGNLIVNGDFEAGNTGFTTEYTYLNPSNTGTWTLGPEYMYTVSTDPSLYHSAWTSFGDHTTGSGQMMIVNGTWEDTSPGYDAIVWEQEVTLPVCDPVSTYPLYAGQTMLVGDVLVESENGDICVKFVLNADAIAAGWLITETHVAIGNVEGDIPQKNGNPIPGKFPGGETLDPGQTEAGPYCLSIGAGWVTPYAVAAHAVIEKTECIMVAEAGSADIISDTSTIVTTGNLGTEPHAAVLASPTPGYSATTWTTPTGSNSWATPSPSWIWESDPETYPRDGAIVTFEKTFNIPGDPADSTLKIAVDNGYAVWVNGNFIGSDNLLEGFGGPVPETEVELRAALVALTQDYVDTDTWQDEKTFTIPAAYLQTGDNKLTILGVNEYCDTDDPNGKGGFNPLATVENGKNPGGVVFYLDVNWDALYECNTYDETAWGGLCDFSGKNWARLICEYEPVECSTEYLLKFWAANSYPGSVAYPAQPAILEVTINGDDVGTLALAYTDPTAPTPGWMEFSATWDAGSADSADIIIRDTRHIMYGDDFCIDDISFVKQP